MSRPIEDDEEESGFDVCLCPACEGVDFLLTPKGWTVCSTCGSMEPITEIIQEWDVVH